MVKSKPNTVMHDNGKQIMSRIFKLFLVNNHIKDKRIANSYPQLRGKVEAYNKIVKNEFLALEHISNIVMVVVMMVNQGMGFLLKHTMKQGNMEKSMVLLLRRCFYKG